MNPTYNAEGDGTGNALTIGWKAKSIPFRWFNRRYAAMLFLLTPRATQEESESI